MKVSILFEIEIAGSIPDRIEYFINSAKYRARKNLNDPKIWGSFRFFLVRIGARKI